MSAVLELELTIFSDLIKNSKNWTEVMIYFRDNHGYKSTRTFSTAKKRCIRENIDFSHFTKKPLEGRLTIVDKPYSSYNLKKQLIKHNFLEEKCRDCGLGNIWNGKSITLQLEHIDGNHYNNNLENLTFLCPNCHSQTATWCRHKKNEDDEETEDEETEDEETEDEETEDEETEEEIEPKCLDCSIYISKRATRCISCAAKLQKRKVSNRPTVEQLELDLKELSMVKVGQKYGVSDNCIRKWLKQ